jgi:predicted DNA-binding transcriptional regulator AlpA
VSRLTPRAPEPGAGRRAVDPDAVPPWRRALLRRRAAARYLDMSPAKLDRLNAAGMCPRPVRIGGVVAWRRAELDGWVRAGCPGRAEWDVLKKTHQR